MSGGHSTAAVANSDIMRGCSHAQFRHGHVMISGGAMCTSSFMSMTTQAVREGENQKLFCKLSIYEQWLCKAITGVKTRTIDVTTCRLTLLQDLHALVKRTWNGRSPDGPAAAVAEADAANDDPMNEIVGGDDGGPPDAKRRRGVVAQRRSRANPCKGKIFTFNMPSLCPEAFPDNKATRRISLLIRDHQTIWLSIDDVDWALQYLHVQYALACLRVLADDDKGPCGPLARGHFSPGAPAAGSALTEAAGSPAA